MSGDAGGPTQRLALASPPGRWLVAAAVLGSGVAFLDGSVVNVALPAIGRDLGGGLSMLQWVLDGYLLTLSALLLLGGALGDRYDRRTVFLSGLAVFTLASIACGFAPTGEILIAARVVQGIGGALLVPNSLALIDTVIRAEDRGRAIGVWAGLSGVSSAIGPFVGGWLVDSASWRWVFLINVPLAAAALALTVRHVPRIRPTRVRGGLDVAGATCITIGLGGATFAMIEAPVQGWTPIVLLALAIGVSALAAFPVVEHRAADPLVPMHLFRSARFSGTNIVTLAVYTGLGGALFLLSLHLQTNLGYSALEAGLAFVPFTAVMALLSGRIGALAQRTGPRALMTVGPMVAGAGLALLVRVVPGAGYWGGVLPGVLVFGSGMAMTVAPLTSTVLDAVPAEYVGAASGANNAISRFAGLLAVAVLPLAVGITDPSGASLASGFARAMLVSAALCVIGGIVAFVSLRPPPGRADRAGGAG
ncbi:MFS transporter [Tsukamurella pseudospumae]|uniref:MFS transporter n=1 Tax=Tsukamurella pseudospumae TaxID=239498 RepID=A0A137ZYE7_9ACTN|nr:MFS transporter [Tsukamurella pseudospumae]KXP03204.1 MFS transporter [Tsukamurella pseudospumae]